MIFANTDFYQNEYLQGRTGIIPLTEFLFWAEQATQRINRRNLSGSIMEEILTSVSNETILRLGKATCEIAEMQYRFETERGTPDIPVIKSESVGGHSVSYETTALSDRQRSAAMRSIINKWLFGTELHNVFIHSGA